MIKKLVTLLQGSSFKKVQELFKRETQRLYDSEEYPHWGVLKDPTRWKPFGVVAPVYWLLTGKNDKRLLDI